MWPQKNWKWFAEHAGVELNTCFKVTLALPNVLSLHHLDETGAEASCLFFDFPRACVLQKIRASMEHMEHLKSGGFVTLLTRQDVFTSLSLHCL